jgi:hypothetical protein
MNAEDVRIQKEIEAITTADMERLAARAQAAEAHLDAANARAERAGGKLASFEQRTASAIYERNMAQSALAKATAVLDRAEAAEAALAKAATLGANDLRRLLALLEAMEQADQHSSDGAPFYHLVVDADVRNALQDLPHLLLVVQRAVESSR